MISENTEDDETNTGLSSGIIIKYLSEVKHNKNKVSSKEKGLSHFHSKERKCIRFLQSSTYEPKTDSIPQVN